MTRTRIYHFRCTCDHCGLTATITTDDPTDHKDSYPEGWMRIRAPEKSPTMFEDVCAGCYFDVYLESGHSRLLKRH